MKKISKEDVKTLFLSALGGTLEFYDFIIFVIFAEYFKGHFFPPNINESYTTFYTYASYGAGYLARPIGGIVMAHFGDKFGRKNMFMLSIMLMVIPTFVFSIMPTYEHIGFFAIAILIVIRLLQGIAIGGELPGAWVFVREHSPKNTTGIFLGLLTCGVAGGILLGNAIALALQLNFDEQTIKEWAWRIPFGLGGIFGFVSIYLRRFLSETPVFKEMQKQKQLNDFPLKTVLLNHKAGILLSCLITWVLTACVMVMLLIMPNYAKAILKLQATTSTILQMSGVSMMLVGLIVTGALADNFKPSAICKLFAVGLFIFSALYFYELHNTQNVILCSVYYMLTCLFTGIVNFAPIFMCDVFAPNIRFSGLSFGYNIAYAIAGFLTPMIIYELVNSVSRGGIFSFGNGIYMCSISIIAFISAVWFDKIKLNND